MNIGPEGKENLLVVALIVVLSLAGIGLFTIVEWVVRILY